MISKRIKRASGGTDTSDATATADQISEGVTAYIATGKVTGTLSYLKSANLTYNVSSLSYTASASIV